MSDFRQILERAHALDAAAGSPTLVIHKLDEARGKSITLSYSDVVDLEVLLGGLVRALEERHAGR